ncbi:MAG: hypothetical protein ACRD68_06480, partial [Pyrinomonadaceae bacterium]
AEMSAYVKSLDPHHLVTPGTWGYRTSSERREWLADHRLPGVDYCDIHLYPRDDLDSHIDSPQRLKEFIDNRAAAALAVGKPLVVGEFGIPSEGFNEWSQAEWFRAYFEGAARSGVAGAMFWIWTHAAERDYGVTYTAPRDEPVRAELARAARLFDPRAGASPPADVQDSGRHLVPHQFAFARTENEMAAALPMIKALEDGTLLYRFTPEQVARGRFEKLGSGAGYVWGLGVGFFEYVVPPRDGWRKVSEVVVRAHLQPTLPHDARGRITTTRVTLFIDGTERGSRLVRVERLPHAVVEEWRVDALAVRTRAALGRSLSVRFAVEPDADQPFGINISNFPEGYDARGAAPIEIQIKP